MTITAHTISTVNCDQEPIDVQYLVLHYTAVNLQETLAIFTDPNCKVSAHLVIDVDGSIYEVVPCLSGIAAQAWHAGVSHWNGQEGLGKCAIGIELVNLNGNIFEYTDAQYMALTEVIQHLKLLYPALQQADRIVGHEHIAGFRGKADPGLCFDWKRFFKDNYPDQSMPERLAVCPVEWQQVLQAKQLEAAESVDDLSAYWRQVSLDTEQFVYHQQLNKTA